MPNWCHNSMVIAGPANEVRAIVDSVRPIPENTDKALGLTSFMPQPVNENGELEGGTSWQYDNWGTKWGDCDTEITYEDYDDNGPSSAALSYNTAWGPLTGLTREISRLHPNVTIDVEYSEPGWGFFGVEQFVAGIAVLEHHQEYDASTGLLVLPDGWKMNFDTDWDDEDQDPAGTLDEAISSAMEHLWTMKSLAGSSAPTDDTTLDS